MEMDLTLWGGLRPLLGHRGDREEECGGKQGMNKKLFMYIYIYIYKKQNQNMCGQSWSLRGRGDSVDRGKPVDT